MIMVYGCSDDLIGLNWTKVGLKLHCRLDAVHIQAGLNWTKVGLKFVINVDTNNVCRQFELD